MQTIFPLLRYQDARAAIRFLCDAFGFVELFSVPPDGELVRHARLALGDGVVMLGSVRPGESFASPRALGGATAALCVQVPDVERHFRRAQAAGAEIVAPPADTDFGTRDYHARDPEGHPWVFSMARATGGGDERR